MATGYESAVVNGQLVNVAPGQSFSPLTFGSAYTGPGYWPRNGVYNVPPVTPSPSNTGGSSVDASATPTPTAGAMGKNGGVNFFHPTKAPMVFALGALILGLAMLHHIHYK